MFLLLLTSADQEFNKKLSKLVSDVLVRTGSALSRIVGLDYAAGIPDIFDAEIPMS